MSSLPPIFAKPVDIAPIWLVERVARLIFDRVMKAHPDLFERLDIYRQSRFGFSPTDLPLHFTILPAARSLTVSRGQPPLADARIEGPLALVPCVSRTAYRACKDCKSEADCAIRHAMMRVRDETARILDGTSLADATAEDLVAA